MSGSDIYTLTQESIYEPLRRCQAAKHFKKVNGKFVPCKESDPGAFKMTLNELPEPELLLPPDVSIEDYRLALDKIKATVTEDDLIKQQEFTNEFGQEG